MVKRTNVGIKARDSTRAYACVLNDLSEAAVGSVKLLIVPFLCAFFLFFLRGTHLV